MTWKYYQTTRQVGTPIRWALDRRTKSCGKTMLQTSLQWQTSSWALKRPVALTIYNKLEWAITEFTKSMTFLKFSRTLTQIRINRQAAHRWTVFWCHSRSSSKTDALTILTPSNTRAMSTMALIANPGVLKIFSILTNFGPYRVNCSMLKEPSMTWILKFSQICTSKTRCLSIQTKTVM